jgi:para-nitrobenzyl esterase
VKESGVSRRRFFATGSIVVGAGLVGACSGGMPRHRSNPAVETDSGRIVGVEHNGVAVFKGIPYGAATSGLNRFMPPRPVEPWSGTLEAFQYGATAPQRPAGSRPRPLYRPEPHQIERGEDCLRLNVWTPSIRSGRRPVMVWWHGGGFEAGSGSSVRYDGTNLCLRGDVVVVTVNHRLNVFGHCYLAQHLGSEFAASGNVGFLDLAASLRWVRENIDRFGGDPDRVMIFGQSGGGRKVSLAMAADAAKGLFHRAVVQSGSHLRIQVPDQAAALTDRLLHELDIPARKARRLQELPMETVLTAQLKVSAQANLRFAPVADGTVFDGHPWDPSAPEASADVPMIIGTARTELSNQLGHDESVYRMTEGDLTSRLNHYLEPMTLHRWWTCSKRRIHRRIRRSCSF